jgi:hypothetical protein
MDKIVWMVIVLSLFAGLIAAFLKSCEGFSKMAS